MVGHLARRVGPELGRDLASETSTRAFAARKCYDRARGDARPWLFGIKAPRLRSRVPRTTNDGSARREQPPAAPPPARRRSSRASADALAAPPPKEPDALLLFAWAVLGYAEIATIQNDLALLRARRPRGRPRFAPLRRQDGRRAANRPLLPCRVHGPGKPAAGQVPLAARILRAVARAASRAAAATPGHPAARGRRARRPPRRRAHDAARRRGKRRQLLPNRSLSSHADEQRLLGAAGPNHARSASRR